MKKINSPIVGVSWRNRALANRPWHGWTGRQASGFIPALSTRKLIPKLSKRTTMPDSNPIIGDQRKAEYWKDESARREILQALRYQYEQSRFCPCLDDREEANLQGFAGQPASRVTYYFNDYGRPRMVVELPGHWDTPYWVTGADHRAPYTTPGSSLNHKPLKAKKNCPYTLDKLHGLLSGSTAVKH